VKAAKKIEKGKGRDRSGERKHCTHCGRDGHEKTFCHKLLVEEKEKAIRAEKAAAAAAVPSPTPSKALSANANANVAMANLAKTGDQIEVARLYLSTEAPKTYSCGDQTAIALRTIELNEADISDKWIMDSGASRTMCSRREWFTHFNPLPSPISVVLGDSHAILAIGIGRIVVRMRAKGEWRHRLLQNVLYVPDLHGNLLSVDCAAEVTFKPPHCHIYDRSGDLICEGRKRGTTYIMDIEVPHPETARIADVDVFPNEGDEMPAQVLAAWTNVSKASLEVWHRRLGHLSHSTVQQMLSKGMVTGMEFTDKPLPTRPCELCLKGKQTRTDISKVADERSEGVLGRIFSDLCKQPTRSHHGYCNAPTGVKSQTLAKRGSTTR